MQIFAQTAEREINAIIESSIAYEQTSLDSSLALSAKALAKSESLGDDSIKGKVYLIHGTQLIKTGQSDSALKMYRAAISIFRQIDNQETLHQAYYNLGYYHYYQKQYDSSLYYFVKVKDFADKMGDDDRAASSAMGIATHYYYFKENYRQALVLFKETLNKFSKLENQEGRAGCLIFMGLTYMKLPENDSAKMAFKEALAITKEHDLDARSVEAFSYLAKLQEQSGQRLEAFRNTEQALAIAKKTGARQQEARLTASISRLIFDTTKIDQELKRAHQQFLDQYGGLATFLVQTEDYVKRFGMVHTQLHFYDYLKSHYKDQGDFQKAYRYAEQYHLLKDSIQNKTKTEAITSIEEQYETAEKEKELLKAEAAMQQLANDRKLERLYYGIAIGLVVLLGFIFFYRARLSRANAQKAENAKALAESEAELQRKQREVVQKELQLKERQLTAHTLSIVRKNELISRIQEKLSDFEGSEAKSLQKTLNSNRIQEKDWQQFNDSFKSTHPSFYPRLLERNGKLTNRDLRLAALIKLGMNNREIANLLSIANSSVDQAKYRLKKKLEINGEDSLETFILQLSNRTTSNKSA